MHRPIKLETLLSRIKNNDPKLLHLDVDDVSNADWEKLGEDRAIAAIAEALEHNKTVLSLRATGSGELSDEGARALAKMLKINHTLTELTLGINKIDYQGMLALADALRANQTLVELWLVENEAKDKDFSKDLESAILGNRSKNLCLVEGDFYEKRLSEFCLNNKTIATKLVSKILNKEKITAKDATEIKDRLPAMGYVLRHELGMRGKEAKIKAILDNAKRIAENTYDPNASDNLIVPVRLSDADKQFQNALALHRLKNGPDGGRGGGSHH